MKKSIFILALAFIFNLYAETSDFEKSFIKGNIQDKTRAVKEASDEEGDRLAKKGIDFILENKEIARSDRDFSALAVASLFKLPKDEKILGKKETKKKRTPVRVRRIQGKESILDGLQLLLLPVLEFSVSV